MDTILFSGPTFLARNNVSLVSSKNETIHRIATKKLRFFYDVSSSSSSSRSNTYMRVVDGDIATANPQPRSSLWADKDQPFSSENVVVEEGYVKELKILEEEVRNRLTSTTSDNVIETMTLIDTLERMGVAHHFEEPIEDQLKRIFDYYADDHKDIGRNLFTTSLYFRLLRQHGYHVPCSIFDEFKDKDNAFKKALCDDIEGLLSLYEASYVCYHEEGILQEARGYARHYLNEALPYLEESFLRSKLIRTLKQPSHLALPKVEARYYIKIYETFQESKDEMLLRFAKLDFYLSQKLYAKELSDIEGWLNDYENLFQELPYVRNNVVECYFWAAGICFEPQYSLPRIAIAKTILLLTILNDTYDSYATMEELQLFTEVILRWDKNEIDKLPHYMRTIYETILHAFDEFESEVSGQEGTYVVNRLIETLKEIARSYLTKAKWYKAGDRIPTFQEHMEIGAGVSALRETVAAYYMHFESVSRETFDWLMSMPTIVNEASLYCRYLNDMTSYEREHESGQFPTAIDCYMQENGVSKQETLDKFAEFAEVSWMTINKEWIELVSYKGVNKDVLKPVLNYARLMYAIYGEGLDGFTSLRGKLHALVDAILEPVIL